MKLDNKVNIFSSNFKIGKMFISERVDFTGGTGDVTDRAGGV
jgi:hypothetical protein